MLKCSIAFAGILVGKLEGLLQHAAAKEIQSSGGITISLEKQARKRN